MPIFMSQMIVYRTKGGLARRAPKDPLIQIKVTIQQLSSACFSQRRNHCISQFQNNHLQISFLGQRRSTRVTMTGQSKVIYFEGGSGSSNLSSQFSYFYIRVFSSVILLYIILNIDLMINNKRFIILLSFLITVSISLRQSQIGNNDWSLQNIGKVTQFTYPSINDKNTDSKKLFFYSQLGLFGHLNKNTGEIQQRIQLNHGQKIIQSDDKQLVIITTNGQIVKYSKNSLRRSVDNRFMNGEFNNIHSYTKANSYLYVANQYQIKEYQVSTKKAEHKSIFEAQPGLTYIKLFTRLQGDSHVLQTLTYSASESKVCLHQIIEGGGQIEKHCLQLKLQKIAYINVFENTGDIYFGDSSQDFYFNFINLQFKAFSSKPISFSEKGAIFLNGLSFVPGFTNDSLVILNSNRPEKLLYIKNDHKQMTIFETTHEKAQELGKIFLEGRESSIAKVWVIFQSQRSYEVIVQFDDLEIVLFKNGKKVWSREQSLAYTHKVLFMKYEGFSDHLNNPYHMKMDDLSYQQLSIAEKFIQVPQNIAWRVKEEVRDILGFIGQSTQGLLKALTNPSELTQFFNIQKYLKSKMSAESEKRYGLQKYVIVITKYNSMFSIDTKTAKILWKKKYSQDLKLVNLIKLKQQYEKQIAVAVYYQYHITYISQIHEDGSITQLAQYQTPTLPTIYKISAHSVLIVSNGKTHRFDINKDLQGNQKNYFFFSYEEDKKSLKGYSVSNEQLGQIWSLKIAQNEKLIETVGSYRGESQAKLPLVNDKKVVFKNVDFSNLAILTLETYQQKVKKDDKQEIIKKERLHLYIINGLTGIIQFSEYQNEVNSKLPINLVYDEHNVIVSFYNNKNRVYQIWTIEAFQLPNQKQLISKKYEPSIQDQDIYFRTKVYGIALKIKQLFISQSKLALLKRNLVIVTTENKIYLLPRQFASTRRPKSADAQANLNSPDAEYSNSKYPPQEYILPINTLSYLNYNKEMGSLTHVRFSSSDLQSTIFIFAYGVDIFLTRITPDKAFDMLADGFNTLQLMAVIILVTVGVFFFKSKLKQAKLKKAHID